jgi:hypothetical protein
MKTLKLKLTIVLFTFLLASITWANSATGNTSLNISDSQYIEEYSEHEEMNRFLDLQLKPELNVKIYDSGYELIVTGNENENRVKNCISKSDLLTEIDGIKYYRLSY